MLILVSLCQQLLHAHISYLSDKSHHDRIMDKIQRTKPVPVTVRFLTARTYSMECTLWSAIKINELLQDKETSSVRPSTDRPWIMDPFVLFSLGDIFSLVDRRFIDRKRFLLRQLTCKLSDGWSLPGYCASQAVQYQIERSSIRQRSSCVLAGECMLLFIVDSQMECLYSCCTWSCKIITEITWLLKIRFTFSGTITCSITTQWERE
jgi:hypothetical protein